MYLLLTRYVDVRNWIVIYSPFDLYIHVICNIYMMTKSIAHFGSKVVTVCCHGYAMVFLSEAGLEDVYSANTLMEC
jgi:hypothetical protein